MLPCLHRLHCMRVLGLQDQDVFGILHYDSWKLAAGSGRLRTSARHDTKTDRIIKTHCIACKMYVYIMYVRMHACVCMYIYIYVRMYIYIYICMYMYIYIQPYYTVENNTSYRTWKITE